MTEMPTKQEIIDNDILSCPVHRDVPTIDLGVCKDCDEITAIWADYFNGLSEDMDSGKRTSDVELRWAPGHGGA